MDEQGNRIVDDTLLILLNASHEPVPFVLPTHQPAQQWELVLDTREATGRPQEPLVQESKPSAFERACTRIVAHHRRRFPS